jgi:hypothetical protein
MSVSCECSVLSEPIPRPEDSNRLWSVIVCDLETPSTKRLWSALGCFSRERENIWISYKPLIFGPTQLGLFIQEQLPVSVVTDSHQAVNTMF